MLMLIKQANWTFHALLIQSWKLICNSVNKFSFFGRFTVFLERILRLKRCENPDDYWYLVPLLFKSKITIFRKSEKSCRQRKFLQKEKVSKTAYLSHFWGLVLMGLPSATLAWYKQPPAMRVCIKSYTKKSPIVLQ